MKNPFARIVHLGCAILSVAVFTRVHAQSNTASQPITILSQPAGITGLEGSTVSFAVTAQGGSPISYQLAFQDVSIDGQTNSIFTLTGLRATQAGNSSVLLSNAAGIVWSDNAGLNVQEPPTSPIFVVQPESVVSLAGYIGTLRALPVGEQATDSVLLLTSRPAILFHRTIGSRPRRFRAAHDNSL